MDETSIIQALKVTTQPCDHTEASNFLKKNSSLIGFPRVLLELSLKADLECSIRQAAIIYFKHMIQDGWMFEEEEKDKKIFISEQDKEMIRCNIIFAIIKSPEPIRVHLCASIQNILRSDFPKGWPTFISEIVPLIQKSQENSGMDELYALCSIILRLCKIYEYKRQADKAPIVEVMNQILPLVYQRILSETNESKPECLLRKLILKIFYVLIQFSLNLNMLPIDQLEGWTFALLGIVQRPVPLECQQVELEERGKTVWWKCKKWALKIIDRIYERYGSRGSVEKQYVDFAEHYTKNIAPSVITSLFNCVIESYMKKEYVSDRVLYLALNYLSQAINQAQLWQMIKPNFDQILGRVIFPLLMHTEEDEKMWDEDPDEYVRYKYDELEELYLPSTAAGSLLQAASKRVGIMQPILEFMLSNLTQNSSPNEVDGALNMISVVSSQLIRNKKYKMDVQKLVDAHILPRINSTIRFIRARACYCIRFVSTAPFTNQAIIKSVLNNLINCLKMPSEELPVKVEASLAIQSLITNQTQKVLQLIKPHVRDILINVLKLIKQTQIDELPTIVDSLLENFEEEIVPIAYDITLELTNIFTSLTRDDEGNQALEDNTITVIGVLSTLETILYLLDDHPSVLKQIEPVVLRCIMEIFQSHSEAYFEECMSLIHSLITSHISSEMWQIYPLIYDAFLEFGTMFFNDCMVVLHAFLTVDTHAFLNDPERTQKLLEMCERTLSDQDSGEDCQSHAAKMLEIFVLQCGQDGRIDHLLPNIVQLILNRLQSTFEDADFSGLRTELLCVLIAVFYTNPQLLVLLLQQHAPSFSSTKFPTTLEWFFTEALNTYKKFEGIHNRKMLIYLLCKLLQTFPSGGTLPIPAEVKAQPKILIERILDLFESLQRCIKAQAEERAKEDSSTTDDEESSGESGDECRMDDSELKDSDDDIEDGISDYLNELKREHRHSSQMQTSECEGSNYSCDENSSDTNSNDIADETELESFTTPLDADKDGLNVFLLFKDTLKDLESRDAPFISGLLSHLPGDSTSKLDQLMKVCTQEENLETSRRVAATGGYDFSFHVDVMSGQHTDPEQAKNLYKFT